VSAGEDVLGAAAADVEDQRGLHFRRPAVEPREDAGQGERSLLVAADDPHSLADHVLEPRGELSPVGRLANGAGGDDGQPLGAGLTRTRHVLDDDRRRPRGRRLGQITGRRLALPQPRHPLFGHHHAPDPRAGLDVGDEQAHGVGAEIDRGQAHA
jgi:hypothetical protein